MFKLVVGLGNPGARYQSTRHNLGFRVVGEWSARDGVHLRAKFQGLYGEVRVGDDRVALLLPDTYMNNSGYSVQAVVAMYQLEADQVLAVCDDLSLPPGQLRIRAGGSDGGHKGLRSILEQLGTDRFPRLRIGIGAAPPERDSADYVLESIPRSESALFDEAIQRALSAARCWAFDGITQAMNRYNAPPTGP